LAPGLTGEVLARRQKKAGAKYEIVRVTIMAVFGHICRQKSPGSDLYGGIASSFLLSGFTARFFELSTVLFIGTAGVWR
jgi:hypothetical protein